MPNETIEEFVNMIQSQIIEYASFGFLTPTVIINFWLEILLSSSTSEWHKNLNLTYMLDCIVSIAYQFTESWDSSKTILKGFYPKFSEVKQLKSTGFSLFGGGKNPLELISIPSSHCWLALMCFEIEHEIYEIETGIWPELVNNMSLTSNSNAIDETLKNIALRFEISSLPSSSLVVYKISNYILTLARDHPLVPVFLEYFNFLYLTRVFESEALIASNNGVYGVSSKFYNGNVSLMKKLKKWLQETENNYKLLSLRENSEQNEIVQSIHQKNAA